MVVAAGCPFLAASSKAAATPTTVSPAVPAAPALPLCRRRPGAAGLEDGTLPFLQLPAILHGFGFIQRLGGFPAVSAHAVSMLPALRVL